MVKKIIVCIVTQSHLCRNPRVLKEAITLSAAGYEILIVTSAYSKSLSKQDLFLIKGHNITIVHGSDLSKKNYRSFIDRSIKKLGVLFIKYLNLETSLALGYGVFRYYKICKSIKADLYICHQELATFIGNKLINSGFRVSFDLEDWYAEDLLLSSRNERPINLLRRSEFFALKKASFCTTTSNALAKKLSQTYACNLPHVIYNVFPSQTSLLEKQKDFSRTLKLFWFSQTVGPGRGLEQFIHLTSSLSKKLELHLLGNIDESYREKLKLLIPIQHGLYFHELVEEQVLAEKIASFDIGLALELITPKSRDYTITNKFFQYLQSGLPIIASATEGQNEGFEKFQPGFKLSQNPSAKEIINLGKWLMNPVEVELARLRASEAAKFYNWEIESKKLIALVSTHLQSC